MLNTLGVPPSIHSDILKRMQKYKLNYYQDLEEEYNQLVEKKTPNPLGMAVLKVHPMPFNYKMQSQNDSNNDYQIRFATLAIVGMMTSEHRYHFCNKISWGVPSDDVLDYVKTLKMQVVEIGAGAGYWGRELTRLGVKWSGYDLKPRSNEVKYGDHTIVRAISMKDKVLLLCWPNQKIPMAIDCLRLFIKFGGRKPLRVHCYSRLL